MSHYTEMRNVRTL